jgi:hypothetical protein
MDLQVRVPIKITRLSKENCVSLSTFSVLYISKPYHPEEYKQPAVVKMHMPENPADRIFYANFLLRKFWQTWGNPHH